MLPGNGGIPFRTTDLGFCSDSSEVIFTFFPTRTGLSPSPARFAFLRKSYSLRQCIFDIPLLYISFFCVVKPDVMICLESFFFLAFPTFISYNYFKTDMCTDLTGKGREFYGKYAKYAEKKRR